MLHRLVSPITCASQNAKQRVAYAVFLYGVVLYPIASVSPLPRRGRGGLLAVLTVPFACDSGGANVKTCTLEAGPNSKDYPLTVEYSATLTGDAEITELAYRTNSGEQTKAGLTNSWSKTVDVESGTSVEISATAEVSDGSAKVAFVGKDGDGTVSLEESDHCDAN